MKNNLSTHRDSSGEFVYQEEFELAYDMPLIKSLCVKHPDEWQEYYMLYKSGGAYKTVNLVGGTNRTKSYKPKGEITKKIFDGS